MEIQKRVRVVLASVVGLASIGLAGDEAAGARARQETRADRPMTRSGIWDGEPDAWATAHRRNVERARKADADVVLLGDSISAAWGEPGHPNLGVEAWSTAFGSLRVANFGFPGDRTENLLHRVLDGELDGRPKLAVVLIGTNNVEAGDSPEAVASGVVAVVDAIRGVSPTTRVLLVGLLPRATQAQDPLRIEVRTVNTILKSWANEAEVDFIDAGPGFLYQDGGLRWEVTIDYVHPTAVGYRILSESLGGPIRRLTGRG